jgi:hypothetical protein
MLFSDSCSPASYDLVILMQNIELKRVKIDFPNIRELVVVAPLGRLAVEVLDRAGRRVDGIFVTLTSASKVISTTQRTNEPRLRRLHRPSLLQRIKRRGTIQCKSFPGRAGSGISRNISEHNIKNADTSFSAY